MTDASAGWPEGAREAVARAMPAWLLYVAQQELADRILAALAPFLAAALAAQAGAMRDRCVRTAMVEVGWNTGTKEARKAIAFQAAHTVNAIRAIPIPHAAERAAFFAAREASAAAAMREACAAIVDAHAAAAKRCSEEGDVIYRIRAEFLANSYAITQAADDVRVTPIPHADALAAALAEARNDDPQWDGTDAAHPAWWRGNDRGVEAVVQIINDVLDGKPPGTHGSAALTAVVQRVAEARKAGLREAAEIARDLRHGNPSAISTCEWWGKQIAAAILAASDPPA